MSFKDIPVDVGVIYEGERIRWRETHIELGGPRIEDKFELVLSRDCLLYTSPSPRDRTRSRMPSSA